jgi:hypothetical protein
MTKNAKPKLEKPSTAADLQPFFRSFGSAQDALPPLDRDAKLKSLLPPLDSLYDFKLLSQAETEALEEAMSDGFGDVGVYPAQTFRLPRGINAGLLNHAFHHRSLLHDEVEDPEDAFWETGRDEKPAPSDELPIRFIQRRFRMYFENQLNRFCHKMVHEEPALAECEKSDVAEFAIDRLYEKPWYELHAVQLFEQFDELLETGVRLKRESASGFAFLTSCYTGELGRLIEQYYWRLRYEGAAITGLKTCKGASSGGVSKAAAHSLEHSHWQNTALEVWQRRPGLSKIAVAETIRKHLHIPRTAKHIARYISQT